MSGRAGRFTAAGTDFDFRARRRTQGAGHHIVNRPGLQSGVRRKLRLLCAFISIWLLPSAEGGTPHLARDINIQNVTIGSFPTEFADQGAWSVFDAMMRRRAPTFTPLTTSSLWPCLTSIKILANVSDPDGQLDPGSVTVTQPPQHGGVNVTSGTLGGVDLAALALLAIARTPRAPKP